MHHIGFFICPGYWFLDLAGPLSVFESASMVAGTQLYHLSVLSEGGGLVPGRSASVDTVPYTEARVDTVIFVGGQTAPMGEPGAIRAATLLASRAQRIASVCTGAMLLAATGWLDGRRATTHWRSTRELQTRYPAVRVQPDLIYVADGPVWTSAGVTAGIDLALAVLEADHGIELSRAVAREQVVHHRRPGGQSQFSEMSRMEPESDRIRRALGFARANLDQPLPIERLAEAASLSTRQFGRAFRRETGETPARAVERLRVEAAQIRLRDGAEPVEQIARAVGFNDPERMRRAFLKIHGLSPQSIRRMSRDGIEERPRRPHHE
ncbi:GlxA family transcriptional regulator [Sphingomonas quercus]|uniref:Helix-turn-helix domain-containing protein n=1 Tax=Sphingomonas quercus TaxID=2842451 RepID=A0ABS6BGB9_9SPHN|nr:helix-turn-helix domain-containing protein [Sphingomonas quercus]MBU3077340.1 helix-turn-helix domain-containing protein [Sphingomonas quercus]